MCAKRATHENLSVLKQVHLFLFKNTGLRQTIFKNAFWLFSGQIGGRAIRAIIVIYAARILGTAGFGIASYALSLTAFFLIIADMGISSLLTKHAAQSPSERERYFATLFILKCLCVGASFVIILVIGPFVGNIPEAVALLPLAGLVLVFDSLREFALAMVRAREKMEYEAALSVITNIATVTLSILFLAIDTTPQSLLLGYATGSGLGLTLALWALRGYLKKTVTHFDTTLVRPLTAQALPLAMTTLLGGTMLTVDMLMLGYFRTATEVGLYSAVQRFVSIAYGLAGIAGVSLFSTFSRLYTTNYKKFKELLTQSFRIMTIGSAAIALVGIVFARLILILMYGEAYADGTTVFRLLIATFFLLAPTEIGIHALLAAGKQKVFLYSAPIGAISNAVLNALFIPYWGITGAALSTLITQVTINFYLWKKIREL